MKIGEVDSGSARLLAAHISYHLVAAGGGESCRTPIYCVACYKMHVDILLGRPSFCRTTYSV